MPTDAEIYSALAKLTDDANKQRRKTGRIVSTSGRHAKVRLDGDAGVVDAYRGIYEPIIGAQVAIEQPAGVNEWRIAGVADYSTASRDPLPYDFERMGVGLYYPLALEAMNINAYNLSDSSLELTLYNVQWFDATGDLHYINNFLLDMEDYLPVSDSAWCIIYIDLITDLPDVFTGTPDSAPVWVDAVNEAKDPDRLPLLAVYTESTLTEWGPAWKTLSRGYGYDSKRVIVVPSWIRPV